MPKLEIRKYKAEDFYGSPQLANAYEQSDGYTILATGKDWKVPVACVGIFTIWPGLGEIWMKRATSLSMYALPLVRLCRKLIDEKAREHKLHRIQARVLIDDIQGHKFMKALRFVPESKLAWFGPNKESFIQWVRFFEEVEEKE